MTGYGRNQGSDFLKKRIQDLSYSLTLIIFELVAVELTLKYVTDNLHYIKPMEKKKH